MKKIFASDFDGTLCFHDDKKEFFKEEDLKAIVRFQKKGGLFGICSGRSLSGIQMSSPKELKYDFYILASGAQIIDREGKVLKENAIDLNAAQSILDRYGHLGPNILHGEYDVYTLGNGYPWQKQISSLTEIEPDKICSISLHLPDEKTAAAVTADITQNYGELIAPYQNVESIDMAPAGCSKGSGLLVYKRIIQAGLSGGIGDSYNDIPLIESADVGFTFHHSPYKVRAEADYTVDSVAGALAIFAGYPDEKDQ